MIKIYSLKSSLFFILLLGFSSLSSAQCCAGGSGSPIGGNASQGVLQKYQMEINTNFQTISTQKFYDKDKVSEERTFDSYSSQYEYFKFSYGVSSQLTLSIESGYYFQKKEIGKDKDENTTYESEGFSDLIIFPRYQVYNRILGNQKTEAVLGLGVKLPIGNYNDSKGILEPFSGQTFYVTKPTAIQLSSGATDLILYTFFSKTFIKEELRVFTNAFFIQKGYNPNSEKMGNYASLSLFASKTLFKKLGVTLQARYEWTDQMEINEAIILYGKPSNYNPDATGYKKVFITPLISYTQGNFSFYATTDLPVYQFLNSSDDYTQVGSQYQFTIGASFRFFTKKVI